MHIKDWITPFETGMLKKTFWAFMLMFFLAPCNSIAWQGKVLDSETSRPIENVVIIRSWDRETATPAGSVTTFLGMNETLTDSKGLFSISKKFFIPGIPLLTAIIENKPIAYKPGYKFLILNEEKSVIELEKIPTFLNVRKDELEKAERNYQVDKYETKIFMDIISKEEEFIRNPEYPIKTLKRKLPNVAPSKSIGADIPLIFSDKDSTKKVESKDGKKSVASQDDKVIFNIQVLEDHGVSAGGRSGAAASLGYFKDPRAVSPLIKALSDRETVVRSSAAAALGKIKDHRSVPYLIEVTKDNESHVRHAAIEALGGMEDPMAIPAFIDALRDDKIGIRYEAATALGKFDDPRAAVAVDPLIHELGSKNVNIQASATYALVQIGKPSVEPLIKALKDNDKTIRREAALALGKIGDDRGIDPLIELLNANEDGVAWAAALALGNFNDPKAAKALTNALRFKNGYLRSRLPEPLIKIGSFAVDYLIIALNDKDAEVRAQAAFVLGYVKDSRVVEPLIASLKDENSGVRKNAAIALIFYKDPRAAKPLIAVWNDENSEVRIKAAESVVSIGVKANEPLLLELSNKNSYIRWRSAWCLGRIKAQEAVDALTVLLNDKITEVQWIAIDALSEIGDKRAYKALTKLCHTKDAGIREKVESTIIRLTGENTCNESLEH